MVKTLEMEMEEDVQLVSMSPREVGNVIDQMIIQKKELGEMDFSRGIARLFLAKSYTDFLSTNKALIREIEVWLDQHRRNGINGEYVMLDPLSDLITTFSLAFEDMVEQKTDEISGEMSWSELSSYKELCGE